VIAQVVTLQMGNVAAQLRDNEKEYKQNLADKLAPVLSLIESAQAIEDIGKTGAGAAPAQKPPPTPVVVEQDGFAALLSWLPSVAWPILEVGGEALLVVVLAIFMLFRREDLRDRLLRLLGTRNLASSTRALNDTERRVSRYLL